MVLLFDLNRSDSEGTDSEDEEDDAYQRQENNPQLQQAPEHGGDNEPEIKSGGLPSGEEDTGSHQEGQEGEEPPPEQQASDADAMEHQRDEDATDEREEEPAATASTPSLEWELAGSRWMADADGLLIHPEQGGEGPSHLPMPHHAAAIRGADVLAFDPGHAVELEFQVHSWSVVFGLTDAAAAFDADSRIGGRSWGYMPLGSYFFETANAFVLEESRGHYQSLCHPLGQHGHVGGNSLMRIIVRLDWTTRHLYFALAGGAGSYREAPIRVPDDVMSLRPWVHATSSTKTKVQLVSVRRVPGGEPPEPPVRGPRVGPSESAERGNGGGGGGGGDDDDDDDNDDDDDDDDDDQMGTAQPPNRTRSRQRRAANDSPFGSPQQMPPPSSEDDDDEEEEEEVDVDDDEEAEAEVKPEPDASQELDAPSQVHYSDLWRYYMEPRIEKRASERLRQSAGRELPAHILRLKGCDERKCARLKRRLEWLRAAGWHRTALDILQSVADWQTKNFPVPPMLRKMADPEAPPECIDLTEDGAVREVIDVDAYLEAHVGEDWESAVKAEQPQPQPEQPPQPPQPEQPEQPEQQPAQPQQLEQPQQQEPPEPQQPPRPSSRARGKRKLPPSNPWQPL